MLYLIYNPLEQFQLIPLIYFHFGGFNLSFTNSSFFIFLGLSFFLLLVFFSFSFNKKKAKIIPNRWQIVVENLYITVLTFVLDGIGQKGIKYFPFVFVIFTFILSLNLIGIIPYSFTVTSHIIVTFFISFCIFLARTFIIIRNHGFKSLACLLPAGAPLIIAPLLVAIELVSYLITAIRLPVRLFANIMSGHILLKVLIGFSWSIITSGSVFLFFFHSLPLCVVFLLIGLELAVAFIQAYVFAVLTCNYINVAYELH